MYNILLVDDEIWALNGIEKTLVWEEYGFKVFFKTTSSKEALKIIQTTPLLNVVFTDIRMPGITGLELISKAKEEKIDCEFIIVSGFNEFEYAREAIHSGVFDYCLKPIKKEDLEKLLINLKTHLDKKYNKLVEIIPSKIELLLNNIVNKEFREMVEYINKNYNQKLQLKELSKQFYMNANYCCLLFKKYLNMSFSEYLTMVRMEEAGKLFLDKTKTVDEVAELVGYVDYYYFNKVFKKYFDVTPHKFINNNEVSK